MTIGIEQPMTSVWLVVEYGPNEHPDQVRGVYSTEEAAKGYVDQQDYPDRAYLEVEQWEVED